MHLFHLLVKYRSNKQELFPVKLMELLHFCSVLCSDYWCPTKGTTNVNAAANSIENRVMVKVIQLRRPPEWSSFRIFSNFLPNIIRIKDIDTSYLFTCFV